MKTERIGISWPISDNYGWGVFGLNLTLQLLDRGAPLPLLLAPARIGYFAPGVQEKLEPLFKEQEELANMIKTQNGDKQAHLKQVLILHALANQFLWEDMENTVTGRKNVGFMFFEHSNFDAAALERARRFDRILVGSTWNLEMLKDCGLDQVAFVMQGIDESLFYPRPRTGMFDERFAVFSGGKLEIRKAQDVVLAAFKVFHQRHPDTVLVTAWHNPWAEMAKEISQSPYVGDAPGVDAQGQLRIAEWAEANGVPPAAFVDLGMMPHMALVQILCECNVALFPNRGEGGTNLVAMEAMASGLPCILSANTGHLDLIADDNCYALRRQSPVPSTANVTRDWGESDLDEVIEALENAYRDRAGAARRGERGAAFMKQFTWQRQTAVLMDAIADLL